MEGLELQAKINDDLNKALLLYKERGRAYAEKERIYRVLLSKLILTYRAEGMPVTIISDVCRGDDSVAMAKFERDCAQSEYESLKEALYTKRLQLKIARAEVEEDRRGM
jgi:hypothetical protein